MKIYTLISDTRGYLDYTLDGIQELIKNGATLRFVVKDTYEIIWR